MTTRIERCVARVMCLQKDKILRFFEAGKKEQTHKKKKNTIEYTMNDEE
jgi:hypothetical protein